jgi:phospholipid/cholesterol/gamma-HCH transport system substrate-binding protein
MENKSHALAAGLFVVLLTALVIFLSLWMGRDNTNYTRYELSTRETVSGLQPQAAVRYKGVAVGRVTKIEFDPAKDGTVLIIIAVNSEAPITKTTYAMLGYQGVTGLAHIQLDDDNTETTPLPPGPDGIPRLRVKPSPFGQIAEQGPIILQQVEDATRKVNDLLSPGNQQVLVDSMKSLGQAAQSLDQLSKRLVVTVDTKLDPALDSLPAVAQDARKTLAGIQKTSNDVSAAAWRPRVGLLTRWARRSRRSATRPTTSTAAPCPPWAARCTMWAPPRAAWAIRPMRSRTTRSL